MTVIGPTPQYWRGRVVGVNLGAGQYIAVQRRHQRPQQSTALTDPAGQCRPFQINAFTSIDVALPIERLVIAVFGHENLRQQAGTGSAFGNRSIRGNRLNNTVAGRAGKFRANMADDAKTGGDVLKD